MKKNKSIRNPDELSKTLSYSSPATWITLAVVVLLLAGFFAWTFLYRIPIKISGTADILGGMASLKLNEGDLGSLDVGQKVYISGIEGQILSFDEDRQPVVSSFALADGEYDYYIVLKEMKPIEFWLGK